MDFLSHIKLDSSPASTAVRTYLEAQHTRDQSLFTKAFADDVIFHGLLYKVSGNETVTSVFVQFCTTFVKSMRIEAISRVGNSSGSTQQYLILFFVSLNGVDKETAITDLVTVKDGKISRVDNCFDTTKMPQTILDNAVKSSNV